MHEVTQRAERLVDVDALVGSVDLVEVDVVGAEPTKTVLALGDDPTARVALRVRVVAHGHVDFGGENDARAVD